MRESRTYKLCLTALMTAFIAVSALFKIPVPVIPITVQSQVVIMIGIIAGPAVGACAACIYVLMGLIGLPVFSMGGGIHYVLNPTFGYILGFIPAVFVTGAIYNRKKSVTGGIIGAYSGLAVIYIFGIAYLYIVSRELLMTTVSLRATVLAAMLPLVKDVPLTAVSVGVARKICGYIGG